MGYRELHRMEIEEVVRRWQAGESQRAIAGLQSASPVRGACLCTTATVIGTREDAPWR